jgi:Flp pilus assembly pilin Flp
MQWKIGRVSGAMFYCSDPFPSHRSKHPTEGSMFWSTFIRSEQGQDMVEYSLLLAFICLTGAAMYLGMARTTNNIWGIVNSRLAAANQTS